MSEDIIACVRKYKPTEQLKKMSLDDTTAIKKLPEKTLEKIKETTILTYQQKEQFVSFAHNFKKSIGLLRVDLIDVSDMLNVYNDCFKQNPLPDFDINKFLKSHTIRDGVLIREYEDLLKNFVNKNIAEYTLRDTRRSAIVKGQMTAPVLAMSRFRAEHLYGQEL